MRPLPLLDDIGASRADLAEAFLKTFIVWAEGLTEPFSLQHLPIFNLPNSASGHLIPVLAFSVVEQLDESGYREGDLALGVLSVDSAPLKLSDASSGRFAALLAELVTGIRDHDGEAFANVSARENLDRSGLLYCLFCIIVGGLTALSRCHNVSFEEEAARYALLIAADEAPVVRERFASYFS